MASCKMSPRTHAISSAFWAVLSLSMVLWAITEKMRWTPFYQAMQCETLPPMVMRLSKLSVPSPMAEAMGMQPGSPPFGLFMNITTSSRCTNPGQSSITVKAAGGEIQMLSPNMTDLAMGGSGVPYSIMGTVKMMQDAHFEAGGGQAEIVTVTQIQQPLASVLAGMSPSATIAGYSASYTRQFQTIETCATLFGISMCQEVRSEQFCGSFGGSCLAESLDATGVPLAPAHFELAICGYTRSLCGKEEDVKALLKPEALGIQVLAQVPCPAATGLPNGTLCNVISAPGLDPATGQARAVEPSVELTPQAAWEALEALEKAEAALGSMIMITLILNAFSCVFNLSLVLVCCRRHRRAKMDAGAGESTSQAESRHEEGSEEAPPTLMTSVAPTVKEQSQ
jgi:hypothetical protein